MEELEGLPIRHRRCKMDGYMWQERQSEEDEPRAFGWVGQRIGADVIGCTECVGAINNK